MKKIYQMLVMTTAFITYGITGFASGGDDCPVPTGLAVTKVNDSTVTFSWNANTKATAYRIEVQNSSSNPVSYNFNATTTTTSYTLTGLRKGASFKFKVRTICGNDDSNWSNYFNFTTGSGTTTCSTAIATGLAVSNITKTGATLSWNSSNAAKYRIEVEDASGNNIDYQFNTSTTSTSYVINTLRCGANFKFKVRGVCNNDSSNWSNYFFFTTAACDSTTPTCSAVIPTGLAASNITKTGATLSWSASNAAGYRIKVEDASGNPINYNFYTTTTGNSYNLATLRCGANFKFAVRSICNKDTSNWSSYFFFTTASCDSTTPTCSAAIPTGLAVSNITKTGATLSWNSSNAASYRVKVEDASGNNIDYNFSAGTTATSYNITTLRCGANFKFKVRGICNRDTSNWSSYFFFTTASCDTTAPTCSAVIPTGLAVNNITKTGATLSWNASNAASYRIKVEDASGNPINYNFYTTTSSTSYNLTTLRCGANFKFAVRSICNKDTSNWSSYFFFTTAGCDTTAPTCSTAVPTGLTVTNITSKGATLSWASTGAASYRVRVENGTGNATPYVFGVSTTSTSYNITGLSSGATYKFKVRGICGADTSNWSVWKEFTTLQDVFLRIAPVTSPALTKVSFYPNPAKDRLNIILGSDMSKTATLSLYDITGKPVVTRQLANRGSIESVSLSNLPAGLYIARIVSGDKIITQKINVTK